jgi:hypothetical protein
MLARLLLATLLLACTAASEPTHHSTCTPTTSERTHWGNIAVVDDSQKKPLKSVWGTVRAYSDLADGVLVEVYARRGDDPSAPRLDREAGIENRVGACVTGKAGDFAFDLPAGRYEIRSSRADWKTTSMLVVVDTKKGKKTAIQIQLQVGT